MKITPTYSIQYKDNIEGIDYCTVYSTAVVVLTGGLYKIL